MAQARETTHLGWTTRGDDGLLSPPGCCCWAHALTTVAAVARARDASLLKPGAMKMMQRMIRAREASSISKLPRGGNSAAATAAEAGMCDESSLAVE